MPRRVSLPVELAEFDSKVDYVQKAGRYKYTSTCPVCGGDGHQGKSWPDRCLWYIDEGNPRGFCMRCKRMFWPGKGTNTFMSEEAMERIRKNRAEAYARQQADEKRLQERFARFSTSDIVNELHRRMKAEQSMWWEGRGIPADYQEFWKLGYTESRNYMVGDKKYSSPAYSIPIFEPEWKISNMQYRLAGDNLPEGSGRYRFEIPEKPSFFMARPDLSFDVDTILIIEGSIKAGVAYIYYPQDKPDNLQTVGITSVSWFEGLADLLPREANKIIIPDPGSMSRPLKAPADWKPFPLIMAEELGKNTRILELPNKIDDMIIQNGISGERIASAAKYATRIN